MKKKIVIILVLILCVACVVGAVYSVSESPNRDLMINEFLSIFKPTIYLDYNPDMNDLESVGFSGAIRMQNADEKVFVYKDTRKIEAIVEYLNKMQLVDVNGETLPNESPDVGIEFRYEDGETETFVVYGQVFIKNLQTGKTYRSRDAQIIEGLELLKFE